MVKKVVVVEDNGVVATGTREVTLVDIVLAFIGIDCNLFLSIFIK